MPPLEPRTKIPAVRALFLILLLSLLPLPFAMASAQAHHVPVVAQHVANAGHDSRCAGHTSTCLELDCSTCHAHGAAVLMADGLTPWPALHTAPTRTAERGHAPPWHARPYRPQWPALSAQG